MIHPPHLRQRLTAAATAAGTLAITLALLAGMPYVLWRAADVPWPEHVSSLGELSERLAQPVSDPLMIDLLAVVGWVCWAAFTYTVIRETIWYTAHLPQLLRDRHLHHEHVATLSLKGSLAALCIGTLALALLGLCRPQAAGAQQPSASGAQGAHIATTAPLVPVAVSTSSPPAAAAEVPAQATAPEPAPTPSTPPGQAQTIRPLEYTVVKGDTLWDIARTHLGDAVTWPRIYALNKDRVQSDGSRLTDPDLIRPGWQLTIPVTQAATPPTPAPAATPPANTPTQPSETAPPHPTPHHSTETGRQEGGENTPPQADQQHEASVRPADATTGPAAISLGAASLIGVTAAAGLLAARRYWYWHQRRLREYGQQAEPPALSPLVDKAAQAAHAATQPRRRQDPDALITRRIPPQQPAPAGTVTIGVREGTEVLLDELAKPGGCAWTGPGAHDAARALLVGILTAAERQRPRPPHVTAVVPQDVAEMLLPGLPAQFTALTQSTDLTQAIQTAEHHLIAHARTQDEQDTTTTAPPPTNADNTARNGPGTLLLLTVPDAAHTGQLQALATRSRPGTLTVLTLDTALPGAAPWHIAADGTTTTQGTPNQHPGSLRLFHLMPAAGQDVTDVLLTAHGQRRHPRILPTASQRAHNSTPPDDPDPSQASHTTKPHSPQSRQDAQGGHAVAHPDSPHADTLQGAPLHPYAAQTSRPTQTKPVRLHVLGPITLYARGHQDPIGTNLRTEVHEFLALLAAHPTGLLASDIADKLHLAPGSDQNALKNLRRAVRRALRAATGITAQEFILLQGELHKLHPDLVETDLADFTRCLKQAFSIPSKEETQEAALSAVRDALAHYRGPYAQGSDYLWADAIREHLTTQATDAALRLARQAERAGATPRERDETLTLLEHLGTHHPDHERLAQHAIRLYQAAGRHDAAQHTYTRLQRHLADLGVEPEPATQVLIAPRRQPQKTR